MEIPNKLHSFNDKENTVATNKLTATVDYYDYGSDEYCIVQDNLQQKLEEIKGE